ncbi:terminase small subunit [Cardiobacteriaceae bacterium TAE3-ERU3]|nr:terminase small subunit [Cardiobacteriaceae bacterium TAE3-ERU3]
MSRLTEKQRRFVAEYLIDLNATQAALRAGYSKKSAYSIGQENLKKPEIQNAISEAQEKRNSRINIDADYVLNRLIEVDQLDIADLLDDNNNLLPIKQWPKAWRTSISGFDVHEIGNSEELATIVKKIKFPDKVKNLELLGKHVGVQAWGDKAINQDETLEPIRFVIEDARADPE